MASLFWSLFISWNDLIPEVWVVSNHNVKIHKDCELRAGCQSHQPGSPDTVLAHMTTPVFKFPRHESWLLQDLSVNLHSLNIMQCHIWWMLAEGKPVHWSSFVLWRWCTWSHSKLHQSKKTEHKREIYDHHFAIMWTLELILKSFTVDIISHGESILLLSNVMELVEFTWAFDLLLWWRCSCSNTFVSFSPGKPNKACKGEWKQQGQGLSKVMACNKLWTEITIKYQFFWSGMHLLGFLWPGGE